MTRAMQNECRQTIIKLGVFTGHCLYLGSVTESSDLKTKIVFILSCAAAITLKLSAVFVNYPKGCCMPAVS